MNKNKPILNKCVGLCVLTSFDHSLYPPDLRAAGLLAFDKAVGKGNETFLHTQQINCVVRRVRAMLPKSGCRGQLHVCRLGDHQLS